MTTAHAATAPGYRRVRIDPITRLEGHGKIDIFLDEAGEVADCCFQVPELRGFERFCQGRPVEEMPRITARICGVCPEAHMMAAAKACDAVYKVTLPLTARLLRELQYNIFFVTDHATHFYALAGPDFVLGPDAPPAERNLLGIIRKLGVEIGGQVIKCRQWGHEASAIFGGKPVIPVNAIPGGMSKPITGDERKRLEEIASFHLEFAKFTLKVLHDAVLGNPAYLDLILNGPYYHETYSMGLVDERNRLNFYDGQVRVVDTKGREACKYAPRDYARHVAEHVEPWTYLKFPFLTAIGWKGFVDGQDSGVYRATPQSRLNAADSMATPLAQQACEEYFETMTGDASGRTPVHHTLAIHWARVVEMVQAAERALELVRHPEIANPEKYRLVPTEPPGEGVGIVEAPRGTLTHHYVTDENGLVKKANLIVGTTNNHAAICMSIKKAAQGVIRGGVPLTEGMLNRVEMAFRAYDPCLGCATHGVFGRPPLAIRVRDHRGGLVAETRR